MPAFACPAVISPGQLGPISRVRGLPNDGERPHHVEHRDPFGDADRQRQAGVDSFQDRVSGKRGRHEDDRRIRAGLPDRVGHRVEDRPALVGRAAFAGGDSADDLGAVRLRLLGVERALAAGDALDDQAGVLIDEYGH